MLTCFQITFLVIFVSTGVFTAPEVDPVFKHIRQGNKSTISCNFETALIDCRVRVQEAEWVDTEVDFSRGPSAPATQIRRTVSGQTRATARYAGSGLANGDCGIELSEVVEGAYQIQCRGRSVDGSWSQGRALLGAWNWPILPSSSPSPRFIVAARHADMSILLQAKGVVNRCSIETPSAVKLHLGPSESPPSGSRFRIFGDGPGRGDCGYTLTDVTEADAGMYRLFAWQAGTLASQLFEVVVIDDSASMECGKVNRVTPLVAGGHDAVAGQFPWHAGIYKLKDETFEQHCGGSLVSPRLVISAAHCFYSDSAQEAQNSSLFRVALGTIARAWDSGLDLSSAQRFEVTSVTLSDDYTGFSGNYLHDIAVVRLAEEVVVTSTVSFVCLDFSRAYERTGVNAMVAGWGATLKGFSSDVLKWVELPFVSKATCKAHLRRVGKLHLLTPDRFCAGVVDQQTSVCPGDSGGGLVVLDSATQRHLLVGVVSISFESTRGTGSKCRAALFTGFTAVSSHTTWLRGLVGSSRG